MVDTPDTPEVEDLIRYDILAQEALRGVVKKVLNEVAQVGALPGEHHFYITFDTNAAGVKMSPRMKAKYPEEMTIVIQHQFWDLVTTEAGFSVGLSFNDIPEKLGVPFAAIRGFFDPAVQFGLQFDSMEGDAEEAEKPDALPGKDNDVVALEKLSESEEATETVDESDAEEKQEGSAEVVSLDAFRKK